MSWFDKYADKSIEELKPSHEREAAIKLVLEYLRAQKRGVDVYYKTASWGEYFPMWRDGEHEDRIFRVEGRVLRELSTDYVNILRWCEYE